MYTIEVRDGAQYEWELSGEFWDYDEAMEHMAQCLEDGYEAENVRYICF